MRDDIQVVHLLIAPLYGPVLVWSVGNFSQLYQPSMFRECVLWSYLHTVGFKTKVAVVSASHTACFQ